MSNDLVVLIVMIVLLVGGGLLLNFQIRRTENCVAFVSDMNASMFDGTLSILPIRDMDFCFDISAFYHDEFTGDVYEACRRTFEDCRRALADEVDVSLHWAQE